MYTVYCQLSLSSPECAVTSLCYSPNGAHLAAGLASGEIQVFDIESNSCIFTLEPNTVSRCVVNESSAWFTSPSSLLQNPSPTCAVAYSEDGQLLAAGHRNGQIQIWEGMYVHMSLWNALYYMACRPVGNFRLISLSHCSIHRIF